MKSNTRVMAEVYHTEVVTKNGEMEMTISGQTSTGNPTKFKMTIPYWMWPFIAREVKKAWDIERKSRADEMERVDKSLPSET